MTRATVIKLSTSCFSLWLLSFLVSVFWRPCFDNSYTALGLAVSLRVLNPKRKRFRKVGDPQLRMLQYLQRPKPQDWQYSRIM